MKIFLCSSLLEKNLQSVLNSFLCSNVFSFSASFLLCLEFHCFDLELAISSLAASLKMKYIFPMYFIMYYQWDFFLLFCAYWYVIFHTHLQDYQFNYALWILTFQLFWHLFCANIFSLFLISFIFFPFGFMGGFHLWFLPNIGHCACCSVVSTFLCGSSCPSFPSSVSLPRLSTYCQIGIHK